MRPDCTSFCDARERPILKRLDLFPKWKQHGRFNLLKILAFADPNFVGNRLVSFRNKPLTRDSSYQHGHQVNFLYNVLTSRFETCYSFITEEIRPPPLASSKSEVNLAHPAVHIQCFWGYGRNIFSNATPVSSGSKGRSRDLSSCYSR